MSLPLTYSGCTNTSFPFENDFNVCINGTNLQLNSTSEVPLSEKLMFIVIFALLVCASFAGNTTVLAVLLRKTLPARTIYVYTINLTSTDLLLTLSFALYPITRLVTDKANYVVFCKLSYFTMEMCLCASVLTLVAIGYKRQQKITSLNVATSHSSSLERKAARKLCWVVWLIAGIFASPLLSAYSVDEQNECIATKNWPAMYVQLFFIFRFIFFFLFPSLFLMFVSCRVYYFLRSHTIPNAIALNTSHPSQNLHNPATRGNIKMLLAIVVAFMLCVGPVIVTRALTPVESFPRQYRRIIQFLLLLNPVINPWIYCLSNSEIRNACKESLHDLYIILFCNR